MYKLLNLILMILPCFLWGQISITSGGKEIDFEHQTMDQEDLIDSVEMKVSNSLETSSGRNHGMVDMNIYLQREDGTVNVTITFDGNIYPTAVQVERKSEQSSSTFRAIKTLTKSEINQLFENGKLLLKDKYPESSRNDSYYRIKYNLDNVGQITIPHVLLQNSSSLDESKYGEHVEDETLFITEEDTNQLSYQDLGLELSLKRVGTKVEIELKSLLYDLTGSVIYVEKKTSSSTSRYHQFMLLTEKDLKQLNNEAIVLIDNYPASPRLKSYYRLKFLAEDGTFKFLPGIILE